MQVFTAIEGLRLEMDTLNDDTLRNVEKLISQAYQEIDKAISKVALPLATSPPSPPLLSLACAHEWSYTMKALLAAFAIRCGADSS